MYVYDTYTCDPYSQYTSYCCDHSRRAYYILLRRQCGTHCLRWQHLLMEYRCYYCSYHSIYSRYLYSDRHQCIRMYSYSEQNSNRKCTAYSICFCDRCMRRTGIYADCQRRYFIPLEHRCYYCEHHQHDCYYLYCDSYQCKRLYSGYYRYCSDLS